MHEKGTSWLEHKISGAHRCIRAAARVVLQANAAAVILSHFVARHRMRLMCP
jgi:ribonuclease BN (tRNA processing enzyme)